MIFNDFPLKPSGKLRAFIKLVKVPKPLESSSMRDTAMRERPL